MFEAREGVYGKTNPGDTMTQHYLWKLTERARETDRLRTVHENTYLNGHILVVDGGWTAGHTRDF